ncbi:MAG: Smr/MutS family protein [Gammaproteobacteria bacterium]|nr:Smr/MutS family protein [Gammaproteobacteria bacterium]
MSKKRSVETDQEAHHQTREQIDRNAFEAAMRGVRRLHSDKVHHPPRRPRPAPDPLLRARTRGTPVDDRGLADVPALDAPPPEHLEWSRPGLQRKLLQSLKRGRLRPQIDIDLHGMTVEQARVAFALFLRECRYANLRVVRIVHGKGFGSGGVPVIKSHLVRWLRAREEIVAFCSTTPRDGGTGAVYVLLRRAREEDPTAR